MGTSTSNPGPTGRPPLLPPWAEPPEPEVGAGNTGPPPDENPTEEQSPNPPPPGDGHTGPSDLLAPLGQRPSWNSPRRLVGGVASGRSSGDRGRANVRRAVRRSIGAMGGGKSASRSSAAGRQTAARFAGFLASVATAGIATAARTLGITESLGQSADLFLVKLADALAPSGALTEDAIARDAMDATLEELYEQQGIGGADGLNALERMTPAMMADSVVRYVANYIYGRVLQALTAHIHATATSAARIREVEQTARQYIDDAVRLDVDTTAFFGTNGAAFAARWDAGEGQQVIDRLFAESYRVVEAGLHRRDRSRP